MNLRMLRVQVRSTMAALGAFGFLAVPALAQPGGTLVVEDPLGDVGLVVPAGAPAPFSGALDLVSLELAPRPGHDLRLVVDFADWREEGVWPALATNGHRLVVCFRWDGALAAVELRYLVGHAPVLISRAMGTAHACGPEGVVFAQTTGTGMAATLDPLFSSVTIDIDGSTLAPLLGAQPAGPRTDLFALARDERGLRHDAAPDAGP